MYEEPSGAPSSVELKDASRLLPRSRAVAHKETGSFALAADLFRYEVMASELGVYVDCDCYCIRPIEDDEYIMGWESSALICNAVLKLPNGSAILDDLRNIGNVRAFVPPWAGKKTRRRYRLRSLLGRPTPLSDMPWGTLGPIALTYYAKLRGVDDRASAPDILYGLAPGSVELLLEPGLELMDFATPRTRVIHLWNEFLRRANRNPPPGSPLAKIYDEGMNILAT